MRSSTTAGRSSASATTQVTPDGLFSLEEVECIGACCWAPAIQINYDFHDDLTPAKVDTILADYAAKTSAKEVKWMPTLVSHPDEVIVLKRRFGQGATNIDKYVELEGYAAVQKAIAQGDEMPTWIINTMKSSGLRGRKWSRLPHRHEVELCSEDFSQTKICPRQR